MLGPFWLQNARQVRPDPCPQSVPSHHRVDLLHSITSRQALVCLHTTLGSSWPQGKGAARHLAASPHQQPLQPSWPGCPPPKAQDPLPRSSAQIPASLLLGSPSSAAWLIWPESSASFPACHSVSAQGGGARVPGASSGRKMVPVRLCCLGTDLAPAMVPLVTNRTRLVLHCAQWVPRDSHSALRPSFWWIPPLSPT